MEHCKTCRWWLRDENEDNAGWGNCTMVLSDHTAQFNPYHPKWKHPETLARARDGGDAGEGWLQTYQTFGCVQHEPKEGE